MLQLDGVFDEIARSKCNSLVDDYIQSATKKGAKTIIDAYLLTDICKTFKCSDKEIVYLLKKLIIDILKERGYTLEYYKYDEKGLLCRFER